jgi:hypothetical protein
MRSSVLLLTLLACGTPEGEANALGGGRGGDSDLAGGGLDSEDTAGDRGDDTAGDTGNGGAAFDVYALAGEVSQSEIEATIAALAAFGTRYTYTDGDEESADYLQDRLEALGLAVERVPVTLDDGTVAQNLVARKDGADTPEIAWAFSAHYDSTSDEPETDAPGADDNASGVAAVLESARILSTRTTASTAIFVFTAAEEQGALGSLELAERWADEGLDVHGVIAPDMMAWWPAGDDDAFDILGDEASEPLVADMAAVADNLGVANKTWIEHNYCYGDDHTRYQDAGFPAISPMDCVEAHNVRGSGERTPNYHRTTDTTDTLYLPFTTRVTQVTTVTFAKWVGARP